MKALRPILLAVLLAGSFYYFTSHYRPASARPESVQAQPVNLEVTEAAGPPVFDAEEQTNIAVYQAAVPSVVNITSTVVAFDFFYGPVPEQGQGSGFILDKKGHILTNYLPRHPQRATVGSDALRPAALSRAGDRGGSAQ